MKKTILFSIMLLFLVGCSTDLPGPGGYSTVLVDNRTPIRFMAYVDESYGVTIEPGAVINIRYIVLSKNEQQELQLRYFEPLSSNLTIFYIPITVNLKKLYLRLNEKGDVTFEFIARR